MHTILLAYHADCSYSHVRFLVPRLPHFDTGLTDDIMLFTFNENSGENFDQL